MQLTLLFIDFGYQILFYVSTDYHILLPLPEIYADFPVQAFFSEVYGGNVVYRFFFTTLFMDVMYEWLVGVLCGSSVSTHVQCISCDDQLSVNVSVPVNVVFSEKSVVILKQAALDPSDFVSQDETLVDLLTFMCNVEKAIFARSFPNDHCVLLPTVPDRDNQCPLGNDNNESTTDPSQPLPTINLADSFLSSSSFDTCNINQTNSLSDPPDPSVDDSSVMVHPNIAVNDVNDDCTIDHDCFNVDKVVCQLFTGFIHWDTLAQERPCLFHDVICTLPRLLFNFFHFLSQCKLLVYENGFIIDGLEEAFTNLNSYLFPDGACINSDVAITDYVQLYTCLYINLYNLSQLLTHHSSFQFIHTCSQTVMNDEDLPIHSWENGDFQTAQGNSVIKVHDFLNILLNLHMKLCNFQLRDYFHNDLPLEEAFCIPSAPPKMSTSPAIIITECLPFNVSIDVLSKLTVDNVKLLCFGHEVSPLPSISYSNFTINQCKALSCIHELQNLSKSLPLTFSIPKLNESLSQCSRLFSFTLKLIYDAFSALHGSVKIVDHQSATNCESRGNSSNLPFPSSDPIFSIAEFEVEDPHNDTTSAVQYVCEQPEGTQEHSCTNEEPTLQVENTTDNSDHSSTSDSSTQIADVEYCSETSTPTCDGDSTFDNISSDSEFIYQFMTACPADVVDEADSEDVFDLIPPPPDFCGDVDINLLPSPPSGIVIQSSHRCTDMYLVIMQHVIVDNVIREHIKVTNSLRRYSTIAS